MKTDQDFWIQLNDLMENDRVDVDNIDKKYTELLEEGERSALERFIMSINDMKADNIELQDRIIDYEVDE